MPSLESPKVIGRFKAVKVMSTPFRRWSLGPSKGFWRHPFKSSGATFARVASLSGGSRSDCAMCGCTRNNGSGRGITDKYRTDGMGAGAGILAHLMDEMPTRCSLNAKWLNPTGFMGTARLELFQSSYGPDHCARWAAARTGLARGFRRRDGVGRFFLLTFDRSQAYSYRNSIRRR